jgi:small-conductance mechanosensitive channel
MTPGTASRWRVLAAAISLGVLVGLASGSGAAQEPEKPEARPAGEPVPVLEILGRAEQANRALQEIESSLPAAETLARIEEPLPAVRARIDASAATAAALLERGGSLEELEDLERMWKGLRRDLDGPRGSLLDAAEKMNRGITRLDGMREMWRDTRTLAVASGAPQSLVARIEAVLASIDGARERLLSREADVLALESSLAELWERVEIELLRVLVAWDAAFAMRIEPESEPLWSPTLYVHIVRTLVPGLLTEGRASLEELRKFAAAHTSTLGLQAAVFVLLLGFLMAARSRVRRLAVEDEGLAKVAAVFELPISTALLIVILASFWLYPDRPRALAQLLGAAALIPSVLILRRLVDPPVFPVLNALVVFWFVDRVRELFPGMMSLVRPLFLLEMLAVVALLGWLMHPARLKRIPRDAARSPFFRVAAVSGRVALVVALGAIVADAIGYATLARFVGKAMLQSAYVALVAYAAVRVVDGLVVLALRVRPLGLLGMAQRHGSMIRRRTRRLLGWAAGAVWAVSTLGFLRIADDLWAGAATLFAAEIPIGELRLSAGDLAAFVITVLAAFQVSRFLRFALEEDVYPRMELSRGTPYAVSALTHYTVIFLGFLLAIIATGIDLTRFAIVAGAFGVGIGFGLQNIVNNFVSGLILLTERPLQVGDTIERGEMFGRVERIGIRSSTVRTAQGAEVIVPNAELISERVINWTHSDRLRRVDLPIGVAYGSDPKRVIAVLLEVAKSHPDVLSSPEPTVLFMGFGESSLDFELRAWTDEFQSFLDVRSSLGVGALEALRRAGIEIPFPQRDLHIRSVAAPASATARAPEASEDG